MLCSKAETGSQKVPLLELTKVNRPTLAVFLLRVRVCTLRFSLLVQPFCHCSGIFLLFLSKALAVRDDKFDEGLSRIYCNARAWL